MCTNIRSVNANLDERLVFLENYIYYRKIDVLILTETWHNVEDYVYILTGYSNYFSTDQHN